jgi:hypothetical protein
LHGLLRCQQSYLVEQNVFINAGAAHSGEEVLLVTWAIAAGTGEDLRRDSVHQLAWRAAA